MCSSACKVLYLVSLLLLLVGTTAPRYCVQSFLIFCSSYSLPGSSMLSLDDCTLVQKKEERVLISSSGSTSSSSYYYY